MELPMIENEFEEYKIDIEYAIYAMGFLISGAIVLGSNHPNSYFISTILWGLAAFFSLRLL